MQRLPLNGCDTYDGAHCPKTDKEYCYAAMIQHLSSQHLPSCHIEMADTFHRMCEPADTHLPHDSDRGSLLPPEIIIG